MGFKYTSMFSPQERHIVVNYHYVENPRKDFSGVYPCPVAEFERQIKFLSEHYRITTVEEVLKAAKAGSNDRLCAITFDDGLKGQYQNALPILRKYGAVATFFPNTLALEGRLPATHKVHILLSKFSSEELINAFNNFLAEFYPDLKEKYLIPADRRLTNKRLHEKPAIANFKETLIFLPAEIRNHFLEHCFAKFGLDEKALNRQIFMLPKEVKELIGAGMQVGSHAHSHYAFDAIDETLMRKEVTLAQESLALLLGYRPDIFSFPHGRYNATAVRVLKDEGFKCAVTVEKRAVASHDDDFSAPRYDTNQIRDYLDGQKS